jgi:hypothetical protein
MTAADNDPQHLERLLPLLVESHINVYCKEDSGIYLLDLIELATFPSDNVRARASHSEKRFQLFSHLKYIQGRMKAGTIHPLRRDEPRYGTCDTKDTVSVCKQNSHERPASITYSTEIMLSWAGTMASLPRCHIRLEISLFWHYPRSSSAVNVEYRRAELSQMRYWGAASNHSGWRHSKSLKIS